jgi:two-component system nitrogen regulation response regulator GlnG
VLVTGESGTGKELVARAIYQHSARATAPFLALNCAAIPEPLLESELFGHERGAFTGADRRRIGKFEQCNGGTLLLDEIGDMPVGLQAKLLRILQDQTFERVGGNQTIHTDVRVIASTHRDLQNHREFRPDLYYRLGVFAIHLPPLRERRDDIAVLATHFVRLFSSELGREVVEIAPDALAVLRAYDWPGNVRELQSVLRRALLHGKGAVLLADFLPELGPRAAEMASTAGLDMDRFIRERLAAGTLELSSDAHGEVDRLLFTHVLDHTRGNLRDAARILGISRQTLRVRLRAQGLQVTHAVEDDGD